MTDINSGRATNRAWFGRALLVLAVAAGVASSATAPARADDRGDRHYDRHDDHRDEHDRGRGDRGERDYHPYGGYAPGYVYAPPPVYYAPPQPSPGINLVFPLRFR